VLIALLLVGGTAFSTYQARRAERRFEQVRKLANTFLFEFDGKIQNIAGTTEARELLVKTALEYLDSLAQEAGGDEELQYEVATAYHKVGDVQGNPRMSNLGHTAEALLSYSKAMALAESLAAHEPQNLKYRRLLADLHFNTGVTQEHAGAHTEALESHQRGVAIIEPLAAQPDAAQEDLAQLMNGYRLMADLEVGWVPDVAAGIRHYRQALEIAERQARAFPGDKAQYQLAVRNSELAYALMQAGDPQSSVRGSEIALPMFEQLAAQHPHEVRYQNALFVAYQNLGMAQGQPLEINLNDTTAALQTFARMQAVARQMVNADAKNQLARDNLCVALVLTGATEAVNEPARGAATLRQALDELRAMAAAGGDPFRYGFGQAEALTRLADAENRQGNLAIALKHLREAQAVWQMLAAEQPDELIVKKLNCDLQQILAEALIAQGDFDGALTALREALTFTESERAAKPADMRALWRLADCYRRLGQYHEALAGRARQPAARRLAWEQARDWHRKSLQQWDEWSRLAVSSSFNTTPREAVAQAVARCESQLQR
jgi:tetratricopeptide (TPR) repeat protein